MMNDLGVTLIWLAGQVTAVCLFVMLINLVTRVRQPLAATATLTGSLLISLLTAAIFCPWPQWDWPLTAQRTAPAPSTPAEAGAAGSEPAAWDALPAGTSPGENTSPAALSATAAAWKAFAETFGRELGSPTSPSPGGLRWTGWLALGTLLTVAVGMLRLVIGWHSVQQCVRRSRAVTDPEFRELLDVLQAEMSCVRPVALRCSGEIHTAATIGWRRPVILLPAASREWTSQERRTVLAHELAHVTAGDSLTWLIAQPGLALHFYHPLVHWLHRRLRLEQELAADAVAAQASGGPRHYLETLAGLAVRQPQRALAWPVRGILPERGTLLRRIEMLRDSRVKLTPLPAWRKRVLIAGTVFAALLISGFRRPGNEQASAAAVAATRSTSDESGFNLTHVPSSAMLVVAAQPARLADRPEFVSLAQFINETMSADRIGFEVADVEQILVIGQTPSGAGMRPPIIELRLRRTVDFTEFATVHLGGALRQNVEGMTILAASDVTENPHQEVVQIIDDRTILRGHLPELRRRAAASGVPGWLSGWEVGDSSVAGVAVNMEFPRKEMQASFDRNPNPMMGILVPLWQETNAVLADLSIGDGSQLTIRGMTGSSASAARLSQTLQSLIPVGQGLILGSRESAKNSPEELREVMAQALDAGEAALRSAEITQDGQEVLLTTSMDSRRLATMSAMLLPAIKQARTAAVRVQAMNNMKQIMLALHNYHDAYGSFPPAVLLGPDGRTRYSWRVAILPFVDQAPLYEAYRRNEPWDSPHNSALLQQIPRVFRSPADAASSISTSYFGFVGASTGFGDSPGTGQKFASFTDGASNTIMVVETQHAVPWTKPEDIPYSDSNTLPDLGGWFDEGFIVGMTDGSARFVAESVEEDTLRNLIKRNDGNPIGN